MHAIRSVDFQLRWANGFLDHFIDGRWTEVLTGIAVLDDTFCGTDVGVGNVKMAGLVFFVAGSGMVDVGEPIESELAIASEAFGRKPAVDFFVGFVAWMRPHGIGQAPAARDLLKRGVKKSAKHPVLKRLMEIAHTPEFFLDVALLDFFRERAQRF